MRGPESVLDVKMGLPSVEALTMFRTPSLQSWPRRSSTRVHGLCGGGADGFWNRFEQCEKFAIHGCSSAPAKGVSVRRQPPRAELRRNVAVRGLEKASDDFETTDFFLNELMEAKWTLEKLAEAQNSIHLSYPCQYEGTSPRKEDEDSDKSPEHLGIGQGLELGRLGKLPLESNGPPMAILQPYLKADNSQEQVKEEKLPLLPLPMPHKYRPVGLPRPSLRRRFGIAYSRKSVPVVQEGQLNLDIRALPSK